MQHVENKAVITQLPPGSSGGGMQQSVPKRHGVECPDAPLPVQAKSRSSHPNGGWLFLHSMFIIYLLCPIQMAQMEDLEHSSQKVWSFLDGFLTWTFLGKPSLGMALDHWTDVAIWTCLTGAAKAYSEAGQMAHVVGPWGNYQKRTKRKKRSIPQDPKGNLKLVRHIEGLAQKYIKLMGQNKEKIGTIH